MSSDALKRYKTARTIAAFKSRLECAPCTAAVGEDIVIHGLAAPYDTPTGDGREIASGALRYDLETEGVPIIWDRADGDHSGVTLGKVDAFRVEDGGLYVERARLFGSDDPEAGADVARLAELISEGAMGWSVMLDDEEVEVRFKEPTVSESSDGTVTARFSRGDEMSRVLSARVRHLALVDTPAFPNARPVMGTEVEPVAAAAEMAPYPAAHFEQWESRDPVPLQVTEDGHVFGMVAGDGCHRGRHGTCERYEPDRDREMKNFHTATVRLDSGETLRVGTIRAGGLHADTSMSHEAQRQYHENSTRAWAVVRAWDDSRGRLCVSGSVIPGLDPGFVNQASALGVSVEKWPVPGQSGLTLVGALSVPTPAWPVLSNA